MRVLLAGDRPEDRTDGRRAALRVGLECSAADCVPLDGLRLRLAREPAVHLVLVSWDGDPAAAARAVAAAAELTRQPIYAVSAAETAGAAASAAGAAGVLSPARLQEELLATTDALRRTGRVPDTRGRVVAVAAAQGGSGVTTVATGLAFGLASAGPVALAELAPGAPALALNLDLQPRHSLRALVRESARVDASMMREAATAHPAGVSVFAYAPEELAAEPLTADVAHDFQVLFRSAFPWTVVDAGVGLGGAAALAHADAVVLVTRLDPTALRLTRRLALALVEQGVPADALAVAANRYGQANLIHWAKAEEALKTKVAGWLPDDPSGLNKALRDGKPLTGGRLARELTKLADLLRARFAPATK